MKVSRRSVIGGAAAAVATTGMAPSARALTSPFNFATLSSSSQVKLLGGNIMQVPTSFISAPNNAYQYGTFFHSNWASIRTNWILPQLKNWKRRGANVVRMIGGTDGVITGGITQATLEANMTQLCNDIRSLGLTLSTCGFAQPTMATISSPTAAQIWAPMQSLINNVLGPNLDIIAFVEPGMQECEPPDIVVNNAVCGLMKAANTGIPVSASRTGGVVGGMSGTSSLKDFSPYTPANVDLFCLHTYPDNTGPTPAGTDFNSLRDYFYQMLISTGGKPIHNEEFNLGQNGTASFQNKADFYASLLEVTFGHPDCMGGTVWGGQLSNILVGSDWSTLTCPGSFNPNAYNPATDWQDTVASAMLAAWGTANRNLRYVLSANGSQPITTTVTAVNTNGQTRASIGSVTNMALGFQFWENTAISLVGTATISGDSATQYTVSFDVQNLTTSTYANIGSVSRTGSGTVNINFSGTLTGNAAYALYIRTVRGAGADGTLTALAVTETIGNAPALNQPLATPLVI